MDGPLGPLWFSRSLLSCIRTGIRRNQLARCITFKWVNDYNNKHSTDRRNGNVVNPEYPDHMIQEIMSTVENWGIVQHVNGDPDQIKVIRKNIVDRMLNMNWNGNAFFSERALNFMCMVSYMFSVSACVSVRIIPQGRWERAENPTQHLPIKIFLGNMCMEFLNLIRVVRDSTRNF